MEKTEGLEKLLAKKYGNTGAVIVQKGGNSVYEYYLNGCTRESPFHVFSVTKSILSILIGTAIDKGCIQSVEQKVLDFFPDYTIRKREKTIQDIIIRDMLTMTAPYKYKYAPYTKYFSSGDWVKASLDLLGGRGEIGKFRYAPVIGPTGVHTGGWGLVLKPFDMVKIGQLLLNEGEWNGHRLIRKEWIRESTTRKVQWKTFKYGYLWWIIDENEQSFAALSDGGI